MTKLALAAGQRGKDGLEEALAVLISSTRSRSRPVPLTEVARWLQLAVSKLGSYAAVADRIALSPKMLRQFSSVSRLSKRVQDRFRQRRLDSVDAAVHLAMLPPKEQEIGARALASGEIDTIDLRAAIQLRRAGQPGPIGELLRQVRDTKTKREYVAEFVVRGGRDRDSILATLQKHIPPNEINNLEVDGVLGRLLLTQRGKQALSKTAQALGVPMKHIIPTILQD